MRGNKQYKKANLKKVIAEKVMIFCPLIQTSKVAFIRIISTSLLFTSLALWAFWQANNFASEIIVKKELKKVYEEIRSAQRIGIQKQKLLRINLKKLHSTRSYHVEQFIGKQECPSGFTDEQIENSKNWAVISSQNYHSIKPLLIVTIGSELTIYMKPDGTFSEEWNAPLYKLPMKSFKISFNLGNATDSITFWSKGVMKKDFSLF